MYFDSIPEIKYEGPQSTNPFAFKYYDANKVSIYFKELINNVKEKKYKKNFFQILNIFKVVIGVINQLI